jgi:hypothetical protein
MALKTYNINFTPSSGSLGTQIEIRQEGETTWVVPNTPANPTTFSTYPLTLDDSYAWSVRVYAIGINCSPRYKYVTIPAGASEDTLIWVENTYSCEQDSPLTIVNTYTGFSTPFLVYPNPNNGMCYVVDSDYSVCNTYKFDPSSFSGIGSITTIAGQYTHVYSGLVDEQYNRLYLTGRNTGGLKVLDMATDTYSTVPYGSDGVTFNRQLLFMTTDNIFCYDFFADQFITILRSDLSTVSTVSATAYPSGSIYLRQSKLYQVENEIWSISEFRNNGTIGIYSSDFTTLVTTITVPGVTGENGGSAFRQNGYYDSVNGKFYLSDAGSKKVFIIDAATRVVSHTITFTNIFGKNNVYAGIYKDSLTGDYFIFANCYNTAGVDMTNKSYKLDPITYSFENFFPGVIIAELYYQPGTNVLWAANGGVPIWATPNTGYSTDGFITKFTR